MTLRVLLAEDHRLLRETLALWLAALPQVELIGSAADGRECLRLARQLRPDMVLMDVSMPNLNGIEAVRRLARARPPVAAICLSAHEDAATVNAALAAGARGYLLKESGGEELRCALETVAAGRSYLSPALAAVVRPEPAGGAEIHLTSREREIVQLFAEGHCTREIAAALHISPKTVATHREHVLRKLELRSVADLTRYALRAGIASWSPKSGAPAGAGQSPGAR
jgi:DNA-binding NarL/FixJ family response regulator